MSASPLFEKFLLAVRAFEGSYEEAKAFSGLWDERLGFQKARVEENLISLPKSRHPGRSLTDEQGWIGLPLQSLETPYPELHSALVSLQPSREDFRLIDVGSAYGRMALLQLLLHPKSSYFGIELVEQRVEEARRVWTSLGVKNASLLHADLAVEPLPEGDVYFIYDLGTVERIRAVLSRIREIAAQHPVTVVGRGRATRSLIEGEHPWLSQVNQPLHQTNLSVYYS